MFAVRYIFVSLWMKCDLTSAAQKPFTINADQTRHLIQLAREKKCFLMEGLSQLRSLGRVGC
jgi:hypothetical protein